jgi:hypothetical protein
MLPDLERDCRHAKGLIMPQLTDAEVSKALSLKDIEAISKEKTLEKYKAVVLFNDKDVADNAFRKVTHMLLYYLFFACEWLQF